MSDTERVVWGRKVASISVGVTSRAAVIVDPLSETQRLDPGQVSLLQQILDEAAVESSRIARALHPPTREHTDQIVAALSTAGKAGLSTHQAASQLELPFNVVHSELLRLRAEGRVFRLSNRWGVRTDQL